MAIDYINVDPVHAGGRGNAKGGPANKGGAVCLSAYVDREVRGNEITGERYHFRQHAGDVRHSEVMLPEGAPEAYRDSKTLWTEAERAELVKDGSRFRENAQVAKHVIMALPKEVTDAERVELAQRFVQEHWVSKGVAAQLVIHEADEDTKGNHHAHVIVSTRRLGPEGFDKHKARDLNPKFAHGRITEQDHWKEVWRDAQNAFFHEKGYDLRVDANAPVPSKHMGDARFVPQSEKAAKNEQARAQTAEAIRQNPELVLDQLTAQCATFTHQDVARALHKWTDTKEDFDHAFARVQASGQLVNLTQGDAEAKGPRRAARYTTRAMHSLETGMVVQAQAMAGNGGHGVKAGKVPDAIAAFEKRAGFTMADEQRAAVEHITQAGDLACVVGLAGTGKSTMLEAAKDAWEAQGYKVVGGALSGIAADNVASSGIESRTLAAWQAAFDQAEALAPLAERGQMTDAARKQLAGYLSWAERAGPSKAVKAHAAGIRAQMERGQWTPDGQAWAQQWARKKLDKLPRLDASTVLVIDEAGMVSSRQLAGFVARAQAVGAKLVLVGDPQQLQPIEAGAAFRVIAERVGYNQLSGVRRQREEWQRQATVDLATKDGAKAIKAYADHGKVTVGVAMDLDATVKQIETSTGPLADTDKARVATVARYAEARNAAGALWSVIDKNDAEQLGQFKEWQQARDAAALEISGDLDGYKPWLATMGIEGRGLAADMLAASGTKRAEAQAQAEQHARALGIEDLGKLGAEMRPDFRTGAKAALVSAWTDDRTAAPESTRIILAHTRRDVADLNHLARADAQRRGELSGPEITVETTDGARQFQQGDRVVFLENNGRLGVRNGNLGNIIGMEQRKGAAPVLSVKLDRGNVVKIDTADYQDIDHGHAVTIHKAQGVTLDKAYVLASSQMDAHLAYVAMSRHREEVQVFAAAGDAASAQILGKLVSQARSQDTSLDYDHVPAWRPADHETVSPALTRATLARTPSHQEQPRTTPAAQIDATTVQPQPAEPPKPHHVVILETWADAVEQERQRVEQWARRAEPVAERLRMTVYREMLGHNHKRPEEPRGLGALFGKGKYQAALQDWAREGKRLSRWYSGAEERSGRITTLMERGTDQRRLAEDRARKANPQLAGQVKAAEHIERQEQAERDRQEWPVREVVDAFKSHAIMREHRANGYSDSGEQWRRLSPAQHKEIESYIAMPAQQRAAYLDRMREQLRRDPKALAAAQQQRKAQERGQGMDMVR